jgi:glycerol-3-phosphate acyltransferase PlsY
MSTEMILSVLISAAIAYLLGSLNFSIIVTRIVAKKDIRTMGSGNAGMTNVLRNIGKGPAVVVLIGDLLKGVLAVVIGKLIFRTLLPDNNALVCEYIAGFFALIGHIYPLFNKFKGGKGILVSAGVLLAIDPYIFIAVVLVFLFVVTLSKIVSLASIITAISYPIFTWIFRFSSESPFTYSDTIMAMLIAGIIIYMHKSNIQRLLAGTEHKFGQKKKEEEDV